jgi:hypothetical protein
MKEVAMVCALILTVSTQAAYGQSSSGNAVPVTVENFIRAESDLYFGNVVKEGSFGKFTHRREPAAIDNQTVIRLNRDTLYSSAVFDLDAGPVTITMPDAGKRFMSLMVVNEDHYVPSVTYDPGPHVFTKEKIGTRYMLAGVRTLVDPADPKDVAQVHVLQDGIKAAQVGVGKFEIPNWDQASQKKVRDALLVLASTMADFKQAFGTREQVDPIRHLIATAAAWAATPTRMRPISTSRPRRTTATRSTSSTSGMCQSTASGPSASTMKKAITRKTRTTPTRSTILPRRKAPMVRSRSSSAAATASFRTACRS